MQIHEQNRCLTICFETLLHREQHVLLWTNAVSLPYFVSLICSISNNTSVPKSYETDMAWNGTVVKLKLKHQLLSTLDTVHAGRRTPTDVKGLNHKSQCPKDMGSYSLLVNFKLFTQPTPSSIPDSGLYQVGTIPFEGISEKE